MRFFVKGTIKDEAYEYSLLFLIVLWAMSLFAPLHAQTYDKMWKEVEQLQKKDLPQSVVSASMKIYDKAKAERDVPQMMKAYLTAMQYRTLVTPDSLETDMKGLENWAKQTEKRKTGRCSIPFG